jgi:hypothetical protein
MFSKSLLKTYIKKLPFDVSLRANTEVLNSCLIIPNWSARNDVHTETLKAILQTSQYNLYYSYTPSTFSFCFWRHLLWVCRLACRKLFCVQNLSFPKYLARELPPSINTWVRWSNFKPVWARPTNNITALLIGFKAKRVTTCNTQMFVYTVTNNP